VRFASLTVTVQRELARRLSAEAGSDDYGPASVMVGLLGRATRGKLVPPGAFWPQPNVTSQMLRIDSADPGPDVLDDAEQLGKVLQLTFTQRRKRIAAAARRKDSPVSADVFAAALERSKIDPNARPEVLAPEDFAALARALGCNLR
jgi:16S rRNA (adenine1518-N6/adenine1519-N6)-dimethyltransferase